MWIYKILRLIEQMYEDRKEGYETILAKRSKKGENIIKKIISDLGYFLIYKLSDTNIHELGNRLISESLKELKNWKKVNFLRGANSYIGFKQKVLNFDRESRSKV